MPKKQVDNRVKESIKHTPERVAERAKGRDRDEPDEAFVVKHSVPPTLPADAVIRIKGKAPAVEGFHYTRDGNDLTWLRPLPIYVPITAHDAATEDKLWEWSAYAGDVPVE